MRFVAHLPARALCVEHKLRVVRRVARRARECVDRRGVAGERLAHLLDGGVGHLLIPCGKSG